MEAKFEIENTQEGEKDNMEDTVENQLRK